MEATASLPIMGLGGRFLSPALLEAWEKAFETHQEITYQSEAPKGYEHAASLPKGRGFQVKVPQLSRNSSCWKGSQAM